MVPQVYATCLSICRLADAFKHASQASAQPICQHGRRFHEDRRINVCHRLQHHTQRARTGGRKSGILNRCGCLAACWTGWGVFICLANLVNFVPAHTKTEAVTARLNSAMPLWRINIALPVAGVSWIIFSRRADARMTSSVLSPVGACLLLFGTFFFLMFLRLPSPLLWDFTRVPIQQTAKKSPSIPASWQVVEFARRLAEEKRLLGRRCA